MQEVIPDNIMLCVNEDYKVTEPYSVFYNKSVV